MVYCLDTDTVSVAYSAAPPLALVRRLARTPATEQCTTAITIGELAYGAARRGGRRLTELVEEVVRQTHVIQAFDLRAGRRYGELRAELERDGRRLEEPDLRIASICLARDLTLVTGNVRHFDRVPGLRVENWLER